MMHTYFMGYDAREHEAACVTAYSIMRRSTQRVRIYALEHMELRRLGLFDRPWHINEAGQFLDDRDGRPFSTAFSHSRFLAFHLASELKCTGPCAFLDCDFLFLKDPSSLMNAQADNAGLIGVVNQNRKVDEGSLKMDGMVQQNYHRKLWSAFFTFNPSPALSERFSPDVVNSATGRDLHGFMGTPDEGFWEIDPEWHHIPSLDDPDAVSPNAVHFSEFSPWLNPEKYETAPDLFEEWEAEVRDWRRHFARHHELPWRNLELDLTAARA